MSRAIRAAVARAVSDAPREALFFVNIEASDLTDPELYDAYAPLTRFASSVVLEITERSSLHDIKGLRARIEALRDLGYRIALDDVGAGHAGLVAFTLLEPDFIKLDKALVQGIHRSERKQRIVQTMIRLCGADLGMRVIAEGVETQEESDVLVSFGCELLQGFFFGRPARGFAVPHW